MCATGQLPTYGGTRAFGPDEYAFKEPDVFTELISDSYGIHVNAEMQQYLLHNKGVHRVVLITDSSVRHNPIPEQYAHIDDLNFNPKGNLSGSKLTMDKACRNIMVHTSCGIAQAFIMGSLNPARAIGLADEIGSIEPGKIADLVFVDDRFTVKQVMLGGEMCEF
jgi:N-acetylglucosamine-6-phosphate deacetylase